MSIRTNEAKWNESRKMWRIDVQKDGVRKSFYSKLPGRKGKIECHAKADEWLEHDVFNGDTRVQVLFNKWMEHQMQTTSRSAWSQYQSYVKCHFIPRFGFYKMAKLTEHDLQEMIDELAAQGLARKTLMNIRSACTCFLKWCRKHNYTTLRCEDLTIPAIAPKGERKILDVGDFPKVFQCGETTWRGKVVPEWYIHAYRFVLCVGLRPGELIGLQWRDVSFADKRIYVKGSINKFNERTRGKNDNARRTVPIGEIALQILSDQRKMLMTHSMLSDYVFPGKNGLHVKEDTLRSNRYRFCAHNGIARVTPYELRHTFVSANVKLPAGLMKDVVGHSQNMDTYGVYGHVFGDSQDQAADAINAAVDKLIKFRR